MRGAVIEVPGNVELEGGGIVGLVALAKKMSRAISRIYSEDNDSKLH